MCYPVFSCRGHVRAPSVVVRLIFFHIPRSVSLSFFFSPDTATTEIYPLSLHDALPISWMQSYMVLTPSVMSVRMPTVSTRSEEHTSELQSPMYLVCRLLLEKKKT